jgi:hypothetical protein
VPSESTRAQLAALHAQTAQLERPLLQLQLPVATRLLQVTPVLLAVLLHVPSESTRAQQAALHAQTAQLERPLLQLQPQALPIAIRFLQVTPVLLAVLLHVPLESTRAQLVALRAQTAHLHLPVFQLRLSLKPTV